MKVLKFGAVWCNGCVVMKPRWQEIEDEKPWLKTEYFDFDQSKEMVKKYQIESDRLPVFLFLDKKGKILEKLSGEVSKIELLRLIKQYQDK